MSTDSGTKRVFEGDVTHYDCDGEPYLYTGGGDGVGAHSWLRGLKGKRVRLTVEVVDEPNRGDWRCRCPRRNPGFAADPSLNGPEVRACSLCGAERPER